MAPEEETILPLTGGRLHYTVHYTESAKKGPVISVALAFEALCTKLPVLSRTFETQRVVAGTLGEPPTRSRQVKSPCIYAGLQRGVFFFRYTDAKIFFENAL